MRRAWWPKLAAVTALCLPLGLAGCAGDSGDDDTPRDGVAPLVSAAPAGDTYNEPQSVTLTATDNMDPTPVIYYTTDGTDPSLTSNQFTAPISIPDDMVLKFFAQDASGNSSAVVTETYVIRTVAERFATSLHGTRMGKETWYDDASGDFGSGFGSVVDVAYASLPCVDCHDTRDGGPWDGNAAEGVFADQWPGEPNCMDCHEGAAGGPVAQPDRCLGCHGRQATEKSLGLMDLDVHFAAGFKCTGCHTDGDVHGDGTPYTTMFEPGAIDTKCATCHAEAGLMGLNDFHNATHMDAIDCSACHMTTAVACYNCHFDNEAIEDGSVLHAKFASAKFGSAATPWRFLVNRVIDTEGNTKIYPGSMQSLMADVTANATFGPVNSDDGQGATFVAIGPYFSHSIQRNAITCEDCHASAAMQQYVDRGVIDVVRWNAEPGVQVAPGAMGATWQPPRGVIPIPPDYATALNFDFVDLVNPAAGLTPTGTSSSPRVLFKRGADVIHFLNEYVTPLTAEQMGKLGWFNTSLHGTRKGKETFYNDGLGAVAPGAYQQGFGNFVEAPYTDLPCADCHNGKDQGRWDADANVGTLVDTWPGNPVCRDCHGVKSPPAATVVANDVCKECHGRLAAETAKGMTDVHLSAGFACTDCHALTDIHGMAGAKPASLFDGAITADCEDCHDTAGAAFVGAAAVLEHTEHLANVDCSTCHMQSVVTCYNCHFDNEALDVPGEVFHGKFASAQFGGTGAASWRYLLNRVVDAQGNTKVYPGTMQTLVADVTASSAPGEDGQGESFVSIAPYYAHAITKTGALQCLDCHWTAKATTLAAGGAVQVVGWGAAPGAPVASTALGGTWQPPTGTIPVPENLSLLRFDFVDLTDPAAGPTSDRVFFEAGPDHFHLIDDYARALTADQMDALGVRTALHTSFDASTNCSFCHPRN